MDNKNLLLFSSELVRQKEYWINKLAGEIEETGLLIENRKPHGHLRGKDKTALDFLMAENGLYEKLMKLSKNSDISLFIILLAALNALIYRLTGKEDIVVKTPVYRPKISGQTINNCLFIRNGLHGHKTFKETILDIKESVLAAHANQDYPADKLIEYLHEVAPGTGNNSLSPILCALDGIHDPGHIEELQAESGLAFCFTRDGDRRAGRIYYDADAHGPDQVKWMADHFLRLLKGGVENVDTGIAALPLLSAREREQLLGEFNDTARDYCGDKTVARLFLEQAAANPDGEAVIEVDSGNSISYGELNKRANRLARLLQEKGLRTGGIVAVKAAHSIAALAALLGILKAGGAYLCVDPDYPEKRQNYLLDDSSAGMVLVQGDYFVAESRKNENRENINLDSEDVLRGPADEPETGAGPVSPAYVIYTSGSTGIPKGVIVENRSIVRLVKNTGYIDFGKDTRVLQTGAMEFDSSTFEMWGPLLNGGKLYVIKKNDMLMPGTLKKAIAEFNINLMWMASGFFNRMFDLDSHIFASLKNILVGGDVLSPPRINKLREKYPGLNVINGFGPTENTTFSTTFLIEKHYESNIPIGKPIGNSTAYILDKDYNLLPVGAAGHLCLGGDGLARGYLNNPELTADKFIAAPQALIPGKRPRCAGPAVGKDSRIYLSGDMSRWLPGGNVEFMERLDQQVKIRGFRVEMTGIENRLLEIDFIDEAVVTVFDRQEEPGEVDDDAGEKYLCAYFTAGNEVDISELRGILGSTLPGYMVPTYFVQLTEIPLTANGKVDRKALPQPVLQGEGAMTAPRDDVEAALVKLWAEVLHLNETSFGIDSNFFELGGHSLTTINLAAKIRERFSIELGITEVFKLQTVRELAAELKGRTAGRYSGIDAVEKKEYYPLSSAQERMYFLHEADPGNTAYNNPLVYSIIVDDEKDAEATLRKLAARHESLRTSFIVVDENPVQRIHENMDFTVDYYETGGDAAKFKEITAGFVKPFDLNRAPLFRVSVIKTGREQGVLLIDMHHIITDGISLNIISKDFAGLHDGADLSPLKLQYKDYACWQNSPRRKEAVKKQGEYWLKKFAGAIPRLHLPTDYSRLENRGFAGANITFEIDGKQFQSLVSLTQSRQVTLYMVLLAAFNILLAKLCGQGDIVVGTPVGGRSSADLEYIVGMLVNTAAMRNLVPGESRVSNFLESLKTNTLEAFDNQDYQFEDLVRELNLERNLNRNPIFDVMFFLQTQYGKVDIGDADMNVMSDLFLDTGLNTKFDMTLTGIEGTESLQFLFEYRSGLFKRETIEKFTAYYKRIIKGMIEGLEQKIDEIDILSTEEREQLINGLNRTGVDYPEEKGIPQVFADQVKKIPDTTAVVSEENFLSFRYLEERANLTARMLVEKGCTPGEIVGLLLPRTEESIAGMLGILKANALCLPLSLKYPEQWLAEVLRDSGAGFLVGRENGNKGSGFVFAGISIYMDSLKNVPTPGEKDRFERAVREPAAPGFIIYTSGSVGKPKGTILPNRGIHNHVLTKIRELALGPGDILCQNLSINFVASIWQFLTPLYLGIRLHIYPEAVILDPYKLFERAAGDYISVLEVVPSVLGAYLELLAGGKEKIALEYLRLLVLTGEKVKPELVREFYHRYSVNLVNAYGQSECSDDTLHYHIPDDRQAAVIPIGKPANNTFVYIMNRDNQLQSMGIRGELYLGGHGLAQGYLNRPELTAEKFVDNCFIPGKKMFRTGDIGRWLPGGVMEFSGRVDQQVKIRGFRVELQEIEARLRRYPGIKDAAVNLSGDENNRFLIAYIVMDQADAPASLDETALEKHLSKELPGYMIPARFIPVEKFPLTLSGKLDRKALSGADFVASMESTDAVDEVEAKLIELWSRVLSLEPAKMSASTSFFELGGDSLKSVILMGKINKAFDVEVTLVDIFDNKTVGELAGVIKDKSKIDYSGIEIAEKKEYYALSSAQKRLFVLGQMAETSTGYNNFLPVILKGEIDRGKFAGVFEEMIKRHESFRTSFGLLNEEPVQRIHDHEDIEFHVETQNLASQPSEELASGGQKPFCKKVSGLPKTFDEVRERRGEPGVPPSLRPVPGLLEEFIRPFDFSMPPLLRTGLITLAGNAHLLMVDMHHIISDGTSVLLFVKECMALYGGETLAPLRIQYKDFSCWQNSHKEQQLLVEQEKYWLRQYRGEIPVLDLPFDYPRPALQSFAGDRLDFAMDSKAAAGLKDLALRENVTLHMVLTALYSILLSKLSGSEDIIIGIPTAGRKHTDLENTIGMFVNTLTLRYFPRGDMFFSDFLSEVRSRTLAAFENQDYPFEELVEQVSVVRDTGRNPLFDVMFVMQNFEIRPAGIPEVAVPGLKLSPYKYDDKTSIFDLTLFAKEVGEDLFFIFEYDTGLFDRSTVARFAGCFKNIIHAVLTGINRQICSLEIISREGKEHILKELNDTRVEFSETGHIYEHFTCQVEQTPEHTALVSGDYQLTYQELAKRCRGLTGVLSGRGIGPGQAVGIMVERSPEMVIGILGILAAGAAYLPIDVASPDKRVTYMLQDSASPILLSHPPYISRFTGSFETLDLHRPDLYTGDFTGSEPVYSPADLAYMIYTSGSTGLPKGVLIEHRSIMNTLCALQRKYPFMGKDVYLLKTSYVFDVSAAELFGWFFAAGKLALLEKGGEREPAKILTAIERFNITHINFIPSMFNAFVDMLDEKNTGKLAGLRCIFLAGEALYPALVETFCQKVKNGPVLENIYGPTEASIYGSWYSLSGWAGGRSVPIGGPLYNVNLYVLDRYGSIQPIGVPGELCIAGAGLARGYLNQPELTEEKFVYYASGGQGAFLKNRPKTRKNAVRSPQFHTLVSAKYPQKNFDEGHRSGFPSLGGVPRSGGVGLVPASGFQRLYRTGDLARWLSDGSIEFFGRLDDQVKVRGYRIELGEIESELSKQEQIEEAVVSVKQDKDGVNYLCAYYIAAVEVPAAGLREYLSKSLPAYMVPSYFVRLDSIPVTASGKIDRNALPGPVVKAGSEYIAPAGRIEEQLAGIWSRVLNVEESVIGIDADFFELGGHSLKAIKLIALIHKELHVVCTLADVINTPTVKGLAAYVDNAVETGFVRIEAVEKKEYYPLSSAQQRTFFLQHMMGGTSFNLTHPVFLPGDISKKKLETAFERLIERHEVFRTSFRVVNDQPVQQVHSDLHTGIEYYVAGEEGPGKSRATSVDRILNEFVRPFDFAEAPFIRAALIEQAGKQDIVVVDIHHIVSDIVSLELTVKDFTRLYLEDELPGLRIQYKDFSEWQIRMKKSDIINSQENYWLNVFTGEVPALHLPVDFVRPKVVSFAGKVFGFEINEELTAKLRSITAKSKVTIHILLNSIYSILLSKYSGQEDIVVGTPVVGRRNIDLEDVSGMFANLLALRTGPNRHKSFKTFLREVKQVTLGSFENQDYQFEDLIVKLKVNTIQPGQSLVETVLNFRSVVDQGPGTSASAGDAYLEPRFAHYDLYLNVVEKYAAVSMQFVYSIELFREATIGRLARYFIEIIEQVVENEDIKLRDITFTHEKVFAGSNVPVEDEENFAF